MNYQIENKINDEKIKSEKNYNRAKNFLSLSRIGFHMSAGLIGLPKTQGFTMFLGSTFFSWFIIYNSCSLIWDCKTNTQFEIEDKTDEECYQIVKRQKPIIDFVFLSTLVNCLFRLDILTNELIQSHSLYEILPILLMLTISKAALSEIATNYQSEWIKSMRLKKAIVKRLGIKHTIFKRKKEDSKRLIKEK